MNRELWNSKNTTGGEKASAPLNNKMPDPQDVQNAAEHYGGMDESQLMRELRSYRQNGQMDDAALEQMAQTVSPMLNDEQRLRLQAIMNQLRQ